MRFRTALAALLTLAALAGAMALSLGPASATPGNFCPQPPGPPGLDCPQCPTYVDPVVCTVICAGGTQQKTFSNRCFAGCSGYILKGECTPVGS